MNSSVSPLRRRLALVAGGLGALGLIAGTVVRAEQGHSAPSVAIQSDSHPVNRSAMVPASFADVAKRVSPCVVKVTVEITNPGDRMNSDEGFNELPDPFRQFFNQIPRQQPQRESGIGSGVIISPDGYIVTNNHVVDHATKLRVHFSDGRDLAAKVIGRDPDTDVAVIKVEAKNLPAITFADSSKIEVGDRVLAIGNPFGFGETVTSGIVSATGRQVGILDEKRGLEDFIQTDAAINPGNSGGALVDIEGRLIGIPSAIYSHTGAFQGAGFAVPSDLVRHELNSLVATGKVSHAHIGVTVQNLTPALAESFGVKHGTTGALVTDVAPGTPAARAGLQSGDVITGLNGERVQDSEALHLAIGEMDPGSHLKLQVLRDGKTQDFALTTTGSHEEENGLDTSAVAADGDKGVLNGVYVGDLDDQARQQYNIPAHVRGAVITQVAQNSASAEAGLEPGDVILEINHHRVSDSDQAVKLSEDATSKKTLLKLWSHGGTIYTLVDESGSPAS